MDACCNKYSALAALQSRQRHTLVAVLVINSVMFLAMVAAAFFSKSSALLSNSLDNLGDALTYALSLWAVGLGVRTKARVALFKAVLILGSAVAVAVQIGWRLLHPEMPIAQAMGAFALVNIATNVVCLWLLTRHRYDDVNMASVYECSRNDVGEGAAVLAAAGGVAWFGSVWPDLVVASVLLLMFLLSGGRVLRMAWRELATT
jgi:Co/Zn/Cd efflux system component